MFRFVAAKISHQKNPYKLASPEWHNYNFGFVENSVPRWPSGWEIVMTLLCIAPFMAAGGLAGWLLG